MTSSRMLRYAYALTGDLGEAQDLLQEAYVRAWLGWRRLAQYEQAESWVRLAASLGDLAPETKTLMPEANDVG